MCSNNSSKLSYLSLHVGKIDDKPPKQTPKSCCEHYKVPEFCLGLCMAQDETGARSVRRQRPNACSKHEFIIEKCVQSSGSLEP